MKSRHLSYTLKRVYTLNMRVTEKRKYASEKCKAVDEACRKVHEKWVRRL